MKKVNKIILAIGIMLCVIGGTSIVYADSIASRLSGKILLQVEENGEAWYINPVNQQRYFMGRPNDAFKLMRKLGVGITNNDLHQIPIAKDSSPLIVEKPKVEQNKTWQVTHSFSGNTDINTIPFIFTNGSWIKLKYTFIPDDYSHFAIILNNVANSFDSNIIHNDTHDLFDIVINRTNIYDKKDNNPYYFEVSANGKWTIEIQEFK